MMTSSSKTCHHAILGDEPALIDDVVLLESIWTLKGKRYSLDKKSILKVLNSLFEEPNILFESEQAVWRSLNYFRNAKPIKSGGKRKEAEFSDALIVNKARYVADKKTQYLRVRTPLILPLSKYLELKSHRRFE